MQTEENKPAEIPAETTVIQNDAPPADAQPKKRGRPRKDATVTQENIQNGTQAAAKPTRQKKGKSAEEIANLGKQLVGIHQMAAMLTGFPELAIGEPEGQMLANGIIGIAEQYDLSIDGKTGAALQLFAAAAMVYAPRAIAINARLKAAKTSTQNPSFDMELQPNGTITPN